MKVYLLVVGIIMTTLLFLFAGDMPTYFTTVELNLIYVVITVMVMTVLIKAAYGGR